MVWICTCPPRRHALSDAWSLGPRCVLSSCWTPGLPSYRQHCGPTSCCRRSASLRHKAQFRKMHIYCKSMLGYSGVALTSNGSQAGNNPWAGRWRGALTSLGFPLVHTGRSLDGDLMLKPCTEKKNIQKCTFY